MRTAINHSNASLSRILCEVPDTLEIGSDLDGSHDGTQITRNRLTLRYQENRLLLNFPEEPIDYQVLPDHLFYQIAIWLPQGVSNSIHLLQHHGAHTFDERSEFFKFLVISFYDMFQHDRPLKSHKVQVL
jgi:hypothetical protein